MNRSRLPLLTLALAAFTSAAGSLSAPVPALPVSLVATALLAHPEGLSEFELKAEVHDRIAALETAGARVYVPRSDRDYAISFGLRMLEQRHLISVREGLFLPVESERTTLAYYANSIVHLFP